MIADEAFGKRVLLKICNPYMAAFGLLAGVKGPSINEARSDLRTLPGDGSRLVPTSSEWLNSTWTYSANDSAVGVGGKEKTAAIYASDGAPFFFA